ncbi:Hypothetical predicted protein [Paramuricea clavata]|uniref:Uncharacterized protein n=1 Tax=Paramuricea clavata TaxID=317549 RepID=A0A7D9IMB3_PARCT|nr:Hypothetical predicted protein [Paramuricea clavata]
MNINYGPRGSKQDGDIDATVRYVLLEIIKESVDNNVIDNIIEARRKELVFFYRSASRRIRVGFLNKDAKIPKEMKLQREPEPVQRTDLEKEARAMYRMMMNEDRMSNDLHRPDSFVEDDN